LSEFTHQIIHVGHETPKFGLQYMKGIYIDEGELRFGGAGELRNDRYFNSARTM